MKFGGTSRYLVGGHELFVAVACEEWLRVYCECGAEGRTNTIDSLGEEGAS